jgi:hypothetical protein
MEDARGNEIAFFSRPGSWDAFTGEVRPSLSTVTMGERVITQSGGYIFPANYHSVYTFSDGTRWYAPRVLFHVTGQPDRSRPAAAGHHEEMALLHHMLGLIHENRTTGNYIRTVFFMSVVLMIGLLYLFFPKAMWRLRTWMYVRDGEPTDFFRGVSFVIGIIFIIAAFIALIAALS